MVLLQKIAVLVEKILRTAPDVHKIYILVKAKNKEVDIERVKNEVGRNNFDLIIFCSVS